eukprot:g59185.t1
MCLLLARPISELLLWTRLMPGSAGPVAFEWVVTGSFGNGRRAANFPKCNRCGSSFHCTRMTWQCPLSDLDKEDCWHEGISALLALTAHPPAILLIRLSTFQPFSVKLSAILCQALSPSLSRLSVILFQVVSRSDFQLERERFEGPVSCSACLSNLRPERPWRRRLLAREPPTRLCLPQSIVKRFSRDRGRSTLESLPDWTPMSGASHTTGKENPSSLRNSWINSWSLIRLSVSLILTN